MNNNSPGSSGSRSSFYLTPKANKTIENLHKNTLSWADLAELGLELTQLREQAKVNKDFEMLNQIESLSQNIETVKNNIKTNENKQKTVYEYRLTDLGPYVVYIEGTNGSIGYVHPLKLGKHLYENNNLNLDIRNIKRKGKNRVGIEFTSAGHANLFVKHIKFENCNVYIPPINIISMGVISDIDVSITEEEIKEGAESKYEILNVRRLKRRTIVENKVEYIDSKSCVVTFRNRNIPNNIALYHNILEVTQYVSPVVQCYNCLLYGHTSKLCKGKKKCNKCGNEHETNTCDSENFTCYHCKGPHAATYKKCTEYDRQKQIKNMMAVYKYTYFEANLISKKKNINSGDIKNDLTNFPQINKIETLKLNEKLPPTVSQVTYAQKTSSNGNTYIKQGLKNQNDLKQKKITTVKTKNRPQKSKPGYNKKEIEDCLVQYTPNYKKNKLSDWSQPKSKVNEDDNNSVDMEVLECYSEFSQNSSSSNYNATQENNVEFEEYSNEIHTQALIHKKSNT